MGCSWAVSVEKARNPAKFKIEVSNVTEVDMPGYLARSTIINPTVKRVKEHILPEGVENVSVEQVAFADRILSNRSIW